MKIEAMDSKQTTIIHSDAVVLGGLRDTPTNTKQS